MKRILLFVVAVLFLAGCSLSEAAEDTTASIGTSNERGGNGANVLADDVIINVNSVKCDVHPLLDNRNQASVTCVATVENDSLKLGSDDTVDLYLGGTMRVLADDDYLKPFRDDKSLTANGKGTFGICEGEGKIINGLFYPCGLPFIDPHSTN